MNALNQNPDNQERKEVPCSMGEEERGGIGVDKYEEELKKEFQSLLDLYDKKHSNYIEEGMSQQSQLFLRRMATSNKSIFQFFLYFI